MMGVKALPVEAQKADRFFIFILFGLLALAFGLAGLCSNSMAGGKCYLASYLILFFGALFSVSLVLFIRSLESKKNGLQTLALEKTRRIRRKTRAMIVLDRAIQWISTIPTLDLLSQKAPELFAKIAGSESASLFLVDPNRKITSFDHYPATSNFAKDIHSKIAEQYLQRFKDHDLGNPESTPVRQALFKGLDIDGASGPWLILPLKTHDQLFGVVLANRSADKPPFSTADFRHMAIAATQLSETLQSLFYLKQSRLKADLYKRTCHMLVAAQNEVLDIKRLAAIGRLLSNATHDLKNPLNVFMGYVDLALQKCDDPVMQKYLHTAFQEAQRCHRIVQDLLLFAQRKQPERHRVDLCQLMEEALSSLLLEAQKKNIVIEKDWATAIPRPFADPHQLTQVFINILLNACQALESVPGERKIRIGIHSAARGIEIRIADNGPGIAKENLEKIFEPFFTTRRDGTGTGLGLSICSEIIKSYGGKLTALNNPDTGASFVITLPLGKIQTDPALIDEKVTRAVLVIDDEKEICEMAKEALEEAGFIVDTEADGESALERLENHYYDLILCDYILPKMNGGAIYEYLKTTHPSQASRFVFMTGSTMGSELQFYFEEHQVPYLLKPLNTDRLLDVTRELINKPHAC